MKKRITYKDSGVDIARANAFVKSIRKLAASTQTEKFGSLYPFETKKYRQPIFVSSTDGVGTKLMVANLANKHDTVGIDLVGMNVNDVLCVGARPLFFLDYLACGTLQPAVLKKVVSGIAKGCREAGCALIGGETAEMPGIYKKGDYDLAGFTVGVVEKKNIIDGSAIRAGDAIIGIASNGLHSNGFSLVRRALSRAEQKKMAAELLRPTRIYVKPVLKLLEKYQIKGMAHITGGAFYEKLTKIIPAGKCCAIDVTSWQIPEIFQVIQKKGNISKREMFRTFNMGIGFVLVVPRKDIVAIQRFLSKNRMQSWCIGIIVNDKKRKIVL